MDMLMVAGKYNGRVFGGFVRDVIILLLNSTCCVTFKDVDIWFRTEQDAKSFVDEMGENLTDFNDSTNPSNNNSELYEFTRWFAVLKQGSLALTYVDIIIDEKFPVDDFDVNCISVKYFKNVYDNADYDMRCHDGKMDKIVKAITNKVMTVKSTYIKRLQNSGVNGKRSVIFLVNKRISERYINRGWRVLVPSREIEGLTAPLHVADGWPEIQRHL